MSSANICDLLIGRWTNKQANRLIFKLHLPEVLTTANLTDSRNHLETPLWHDQAGILSILTSVGRPPPQYRRCHSLAGTWSAQTGKGDEQQKLQG